ncbi:ABC transporter permease subunit [Schumannella luteola]|uniref:ABC-2 type transport system permease protein n=1 Tax=Schumannella luteola TaxID=472059 RepID=A0A852YGJ1_9MICO|nr:ABC transporter permease subunit [Schumannella luteola]NYH00262.1 ABC-2 type transport system permease protein [Schumannella luteola]TPX01494.1 ABC transporter permease subunit [Schumannella luteola]
MTAATLAPSAGATNTTRPGVTFGRVLRSEWIKFTSLRSTFWTSAIILVLWIGLAAMLAATAPTELAPGADPDENGRFLLGTVVTTGASIGVLVAAIQGVLIISGEYSTGMIRSSLAAVPRRLPVLFGKAIVAFVWMFLLGAVGVLGSLGVAAALFTARDIPLVIDGDVLTAFAGAALYLGLVAVFGLGIGTAVRSSAGGIAIALGVLLVLPTLLMVLSSWLDWIGDVMKFLISQAGSTLASVPGPSAMALGGAADDALTPAVAAIVVLVWAVAALVLGAIALKRRDA